MSDELRTSNIKPYMDMISNLKMEIQSLKAHAVEVLSKECCKFNRIADWEMGEFDYESEEEEYKDQYRAEARALLGWEEDT